MSSIGCGLWYRRITELQEGVDNNRQIRKADKLIENTRRADIWRKPVTAEGTSKRDLGADDDEDVASFKRVRIVDEKPVKPQRLERWQDKEGGESKLDPKRTLKSCSGYWSVSEVIEFIDNVAYFGTDWLAIADHIGTKTQTMVCLEISPRSR